MSLSRYENQETIVQLNEPQYGQLFTTDDLRVLPHSYLIPNDPNILSANISQVHIYSFYGDYIAGDHQAGYIIRDDSTNSLLIDLADTFRQANIRRGSYIIAVNLFKQLWGDPDNHVVILREISPDRTELKLIVPSSVLVSGGFTQFKQAIDTLKQNNILNNVVLDFGFNHIAKIVSIKYDPVDDGVVYVKLYKPLYDDISEKESAWFGFEVVDPYIDTVLLSTPLTPTPTHQMRGPNFNLDTSEWASNSTIFKTWDDLLDSDLPTSQRVIDLAISGSAVARLNIDYTSFNNFIFYSSAEERLRNFKYKLGLIEGYNDSITTLQTSTASLSTYISSSVALQQRRIDQITTTLDHFERWLYYADTGSIFTHDISGSLTPWPKYLRNGRYVLHHTTSSLATSWFNVNVASASAYDEKNYNRLWWSIPEHVIMDRGNDDYVAFVEMVAEHFDNLYAYVKSLTQIHERDEHPERGPSRDLLYPIAKSFGWNLQNTRQLSDIWFYKLGTNSSGQYENTGSLFSLSGEDQTHQIWRRIVNNLPFLLKTKGTARSVKAMMSIYGIPQTLISIKEYGGPTIEADAPSWIEDRFYYQANFTGSNYISMPRRPIPANSGSWSGVTRPSDLIEFRFKTHYSSSVSMSMWASMDTAFSDVEAINLELVHSRSTYNSQSYSGSNAYGFLRFSAMSWDYTGPDTVTYTASSSLYPFFNDEYWTVQIYVTNPVTGSYRNGPLYVRFGQASDYNAGEVFATGSFYLSGSRRNGYTQAWGHSSDYSTLHNTPHRVLLGGATHSLANYAIPVNRFVGKIQGYKEYFGVMSDATFRQHILNPNAYNVDNETGSYYQLFRYFPLGLDQQRWNHTSYTQVSSSHPNRKASFDTTASFVNWTGSQSTQYVSDRETYFIYPPSLGGNTFRSKKLRLESNRITNDLSPSARSERSQFDLATIDTNRLAVVFAPSDHVNRDIADHMGNVRLDQWIADPAYEYDEEYSELKRFSQQYWQKYQQKNDINALIRILSVYDYTFFEQIKQLIPGRADYIGGILIEPNVLERSKVRLTRRPTVENPQYEQDITYETVQTGEYLTYEGVVTSSAQFEMAYTYNTASVDLDSSRDFSMLYTYHTASITDPVIISGASLHHFDSTHQRTGLCGVVDVYPNRYSGSQCETGSTITLQRINHQCKYYKVIYHYSSSGTFQSKYLRQWYTAVSMSYNWYYSRSLETSGYQIDECGTRNNSRYRGSKMSAVDFNVDSPDTVDGGPVVTIIESNPNNLFVGGESNTGNLFVE